MRAERTPEEEVQRRLDALVAHIAKARMTILEAADQLHMMTGELQALLDEARREDATG